MRHLSNLRTLLLQYIESGSVDSYYPTGQMFLANKMTASVYAITETVGLMVPHNPVCGILQGNLAYAP